MTYPIKYLEDNLIFNQTNDCYAYYELIPYNYSFLSPEQKMQVHDSFRQLIAQNREGNIHALQLSTESSIKQIQEHSKKTVTGKLKETAHQHIDGQTEALVDLIGENQIDYRYFIGFKLMLNEKEVSLKNIWSEIVDGFEDFIHSANKKLISDFTVMNNSKSIDLKRWNNF